MFLFLREAAVLSLEPFHGTGVAGVVQVQHGFDPPGEPLDAVWPPEASQAVVDRLLELAEPGTDSLVFFGVLSAQALALVLVYRGDEVALENRRAIPFVPQTFEEAPLAGAVILAQ